MDQIPVSFILVELLQIYTTINNSRLQANVYISYPLTKGTVGTQLLSIHSL